MKRYPDILTTAEAARLLNCSVQTVIRCIDRGLLPCWRVPNAGQNRQRQDRRLLRQAVEEYARKNNIPLGK